MKTYEVLEAGFLAGDHYAVGDRVQMTPKAAKYFLPPYANRLREITATAPGGRLAAGESLVAPSDSPAGSRPEGVRARRSRFRDGAEPGSE